MTENTIFFTPKAEFRKGIHCLLKGVMLVARSLFRGYDNSLHKHPYIHIVVILLCVLAEAFFSTMHSRSELSALTEENYQIQQQLDSIRAAKGLTFNRQ